MDRQTQCVHVEVARDPRSDLKRSEVEGLVKEALNNSFNPVDNFRLHDPANKDLRKHVTAVSFCSVSSTWADPDGLEFHAACTISDDNPYSDNTLETSFRIHVYELNDDGENAEFMDDDEEAGSSPSSHHWVLPSANFHGLWDSLIFESDVKTRLIDYVQTAILYADKNVDASLISWNKVILLHGPPGTGKTSLCKALAHKATIRLSSRFTYGQLIEINSHSLFSKWFSESGKLVMKMFDKIQELIEDPQSIVFLLIDEVESLAQCRLSAESGNEPSDSIRAVNALLTQIDRIKRYPNVMILTTSNVVGSIDLAFVDRADLKIFIGNPPADIIYGILASSVNELIRVGIVLSEDKAMLPLTYTNLDKNHSLYDCAHQLSNISNLSVNLSGRTLRKIPFLTHVNFVRRENCTLYEFLAFMKKAVEVEKAEALALKRKS
ncbi:unnamed protein product [Allacma fusca]|uniref:AAA+ ATPase domain-containing protein n=1 Tax=Allacma fusca TaxID=39272 RepID=A0A8J2PAM3_9HEXA|nr:unnamed protein product [Allacma fusca]